MKNKNRSVILLISLAQLAFSTSAFADLLGYNDRCTSNSQCRIDCCVNGKCAYDASSCMAVAGNLNTVKAISSSTASTTQNAAQSNSVPAPAKAK